MFWLYLITGVSVVIICVIVILYCFKGPITWTPNKKEIKK
jgi:hypothetical protein